MRRQATMRALVAWAAASALAGGCGGEGEVATGDAVADIGGVDGGGVDGVAGDGVGADGVGDATDDGGNSDGGGSAETAAGDDGDAALGDHADAPTLVCVDGACDDGLACTVDECSMPGATCAWLQLPGTCLIGGVCFAKGDANPLNPCEVCAPELKHKAFSARADGAACEDGKTCTVGDSCSKGVCGGAPLTCGDDNPCTADVCSQGKGCTYPPVAGSVACDDGDACTKDDLCVEGSCAATPLACSDGKLCTLDGCDATQGCTFTPSTAPCSDGDACTTDDVCDAGSCQAGATANCDDGNACTLDGCDALAGCHHLPTQNPCCTGAVNICDDGNPCTTDDCDPASGGCSTTHNTAGCNDNDACTAKDACAKGACGGKLQACDDGNPCSSDSCDPKKGCVFAAGNEGKACNDGDPCSTGDACQAGVCKGKGGCACTPVFSPTVSKVTSLQIGKGGKPGEGLDLDGNVKTCAPSTNCSDGIDNALGSLAGLVNNQLDKPVAEGSILLLVEVKEFKQGPVTLAIHQGKLAPSNLTCAIQKETCSYLADPSLIDPLTCGPKAGLAGTVVGTALKAGGKGTVFPLQLPLQDGVFLKLTLYDIQLQGTLVVNGKDVTSFEGILAGAVPKAQLLAAIDALPDEGLPLPKDAIKTLLDSTVEADIDADGDGKKESSSLSLKVKGIGAKIIGVTK